MPTSSASTSRTPIPPAEKVAARALALNAIVDLRGGRYLLYVRVNGPTTGLMEDDLDAVVHPGLDGVIVSKTDSVEVVERVEATIARLERSRGIEPGSVAIAPLVETAAGIMYAREICAASDRLSGAVFGAEDYATDMGIQRTEAGRGDPLRPHPRRHRLPRRPHHADRHPRPGLHGRGPPRARDVASPAASATRASL